MGHAVHAVGGGGEPLGLDFEVARQEFEHMIEPLRQIHAGPVDTEHMIEP